MRRALGHPFRIKALSILAERVASPRELAEAMDVELSLLSYHVRVLRELDLIEVVREEKVRGAVAHFYKAVDRPWVDDEEWESLDPEAQAMFVNFVFTLLAADLDRSVASENWRSRPDSHLTRYPLVLDDEGWSTVGKILMKTLDDIHAVHMESVKRLKGSSEGEVRAVIGLMFFEAAPRA